MSSTPPAGGPGGATPAPAPAALGRALAAWVGLVSHWAPWVAIAFAVGAGFLLLRVVPRLGVDTDTADMISERLPWRQSYIRYKEAFPQYVDEVLVVIEGATPDLADRGRRRLADLLRAEPDLFETVYLPGGGPFFDRHALLYPELEELAELAEGLERFGPWLRRLEADLSLAGFLHTLEGMLAAARRGEEALEMAPFLGAVAEAFAAPLDWRFHELSWQEMLHGRRATAAERRAFVIVQLRLDFGSLLPAEKAMKRLRELAREAGLVPERGVRLRLSGSVAMEHEELGSVLRGARTAGLLALLMVTAVLYLGLRSVRLMAASVGTLLAGLVATAGFAAVAVGHLNLISVAFAVLYIGLGIDYAIHFCLRYREVAEERPHEAALRAAAADVGPSLALSAVTTAACFYAFIPTDFTGVSELGLISGTGMFVSLFATLTLLPALLTLLPAGRAGTVPAGAAPPAQRAEGPAAGAGDGGRGAAPVAVSRRAGEAESSSPRVLALRAADRWLGRLSELVRRRPRTVAWAALLLGLGCAALLPRVRFDYNPLNLRDPSTESVATFRDLLADPAASPLTLAILEPGRAEARATAERVARLDVVEEAVTLDDFVPRRQEEKRRLIREVAAALDESAGRPVTGEGPIDPSDSAARRPASAGAPAGGADPSDPGTSTGSGAVTAVEQLLESLARFRPFAGREEAGAARYLGFQARAWLGRVKPLPAGEQARWAEEVERSLLGSLPGRLDALRASLDAGLVGAEDLPEELVRRWVSPAGLHRVEVIPRENVGETEALRRFVDGVREVAPGATGPPVVELESGNAVVRAFRVALVAAGVATLVILLLVLRSLGDTALVLLPLILAGLLTAAWTVVLGPPFNFANIIAVPLLLGVGVDNGIHMVHRVRAAPPAHGELLRTSTASAVLFACLTTVVSFGNLALSEHPGTASMGLLLTTGMLAVLACTLVVIPALLSTGLGSGIRGWPGVEGRPGARGARGSPG